MEDVTVYDLMGVCEQCRDFFSVFVRVRRRPNPPGDTRWLHPTGKTEVVRGRIERSTTVWWEDGRVTHRCGGTVSLFGNFPHLRIVVEE